MPIIPFVNLKGGVAKTTNAVALAESLADSGHRVLVIDADHQCMAGELLLGEDRLDKAERGRRTLHDLLAAMLDDDFEDSMIDRFVESGASDVEALKDRLFVIPCSFRIDDFQTNRARAGGGFQTNEAFYRAWTKRLRMFERWCGANFGFTIVDCPPSLALQVRYLLRLSDGYIVPAIPDRLSVRGSLRLVQRIHQLGFACRPLGTLWSLYRCQVTSHRDIVQWSFRRGRSLQALPLPFETVIPNAAAITRTTEAGQLHKSFSAKYTRQFAQLYSDLAREVIARCSSSEGSGNEERRIPPD